MDCYLQVAGRNWVLVDDLVDDGSYILSRKRTLSGRHFIEQDPETEQISPPVELQPFYLLRRHVVGRAQDLAAMRHAACGLGDAEIHDLGHVLTSDHDVGRL